MNKFFLLMVFTCFSSVAFPSDTVKKVLYSLIDSLVSINTATYRVENTERIEGEYMSGSQYISYQKSPFKCKVEFISPNTGSQVAFSHKDEDAIYSPVGFPYFDLSLDPLGGLMRRNNHHTIYEVGFDYIISIVRAALNKEGNLFEMVEETATYYTINITNPNFGFEEYQVKHNETIRTISLQKNLNEYLILERNKNVDFYDNISEGDIIFIPNSYAKEVKLVINKDGFVLEDIFVCDQNGLFEEYHYSELKKNISELNLELDN